ncbi:hypothetical protein J2Y73_002059 [Peribacillus frigoritolerans]|nr:hypothetical protein [Peribacillus frigoritolerans]MCP1492028.1 hypothetical protein [Peribacillus frigoritolerans]
MAYAYSPFVITLICFVCYRLIKRKLHLQIDTHLMMTSQWKLKMTYKPLQDTTNHHIQ